MAGSCESRGQTVRVDPERVRALQLLLYPDATPLADGDPLPALWHWMALPRWTDPAGTGPDGHPRRPAGLEDTAVRRMFAGGEVVFGTAPLRVGEQVSVASDLGEVVKKTGRSGDFVLATFASTITNLDGDLVVSERQDVVYTDPRPADLTAPQGALPIVGRPLVPRADGGVDLLTDPTVLLRFSALSANAHRIHYDLAYAREVEGLPGLLVHGPLINLALAGVAGAGTGRAVRRIQHRNLSPLFVGERAVLALAGATPESPSESQSEPRSDTVTAEATTGDGRTTSRVVVEFHAPQEDQS